MILVCDAAWRVNYAGCQHRALYEALVRIREQYKAGAGLLIPVVNSDGTGKSRMVDEMGKYIFTVAMQLGPGTPASVGSNGTISVIFRVPRCD